MPTPCRLFYILACIITFLTSSITSQLQAMTSRAGALSRRNENHNQNNIAGQEIPSRHPSLFTNQSYSTNNHHRGPQRVAYVRRFSHGARRLWTWLALGFLGLVGFLCSWGSDLGKEHGSQSMKILPQSGISPSLPELSRGLSTRGTSDPNPAVVGLIPRQMVDGQMDVLVMLSEIADALPDLPSYRWIYVHETSVHNMTPPALRCHLHRLFVLHRPILVLSVGDYDTWMERGVGTMPYNFRRLWVHLEEGKQVTENLIAARFLESVNPNRHRERPLVSVVTPTYRSGRKLHRAYQSLLSQTYDYWEWIIWDDSPDEDTYTMVQAMALEDMRIQVFKAPQRSGIIGEMKSRAASLASGKWLVELDHDDRLAPRLFEWIRDIASRFPATKFIYSDHSELGEEDDKPFSYGENYGYNYGSYVRQHVRSHVDGPLRPHYISRNGWPNPHTLRHLIGLPNHVRVWNRAFYESIGGHATFLSVADDYDLLLRSFLNAEPGEWVCITAPAYFQYRNAGGENFTIKRNALIQHLVQELYRWYHPQLLAKYGTLGWKETPGWPQQGVWETDLVDVEPRMEHYFVPEDQEPGTPCISIILPTYHGGDAFQKTIEAITRQSYMNWKLFIIGDGCPQLDALAEENIPTLFPGHLDRLFWYNLRDHHDDGFVTARNYALRMIVKTEWVTYAHQKAVWEPNHLERLVKACTRANEAAENLCGTSNTTYAKPTEIYSRLIRLVPSKVLGE